MQLDPYLAFPGTCEEAFTFYATCFDAEVGGIMRFGNSPAAEHVPPDWHDKVMHATIAIGGRAVMGSDLTPDRYEAPHGVHLAISLTDVAQTERIFEQLSAGGTVEMALEKTFWAERFGMVVDRFGIPWMFSCTVG